MNAHSTEPNTKKPYQKPAMRIVGIAEGTQTLGNGCKLTSGGTSKGIVPCWPGNRCTQQGS